MKACSKCAATKPLSEFYKRPSSKDGVRADCKTCANARAQSYAERNAQKVAAYKASWRLSDLERIRAMRKAAYHRDRQAAIAKVAKWAAENPELARANKNRWKKLNPAHTRMMSSKRRAAMLKATPAWANQAEILKIYQKAIETGMTVDHIVPLLSKKVCGLHCEANLQLLPLRENLSKNNKRWPDMPCA
jgi:glutamyl/glutaminyl-tRNA synthetase